MTGAFVSVPNPIYITIPLGRRISEILEVKGITPNAFSQRIKMGKDTLYKCLSGERYIKPSELQRMAEVLRLTIDRIKQDDTLKLALELRTLVLNKSNLKRAVRIANELGELAIGYSERFDLLNDLGSAHHYLQQFDLAHRYWLEALPLAEKIKEKYSDPERLYKITNNLILSFTRKKDYSSLAQLLHKVEPAFLNSDSERAGTFLLSSAMIAYNMGDLEQYKQKMYEASDWYLRTDKPRLLDIAKNNIAYVEYQTGNLVASKSLYETLIATPSQFDDLRFIAIKGYIKTLWQLKEKRKAIHLTETALSELKQTNLQELKAKFFLLHAIITDQPESAEAVLEIPDAGNKMYYFACRLLVDYSVRINDESSLMKYYKHMERFDESPLSVWEEI